MPKHALPPPSPQEIAAHARAAFMRRLDAEADPDGTLSVEQRTQRVKDIRRAHFSALGRSGGLAKARNVRDNATGGGNHAE